MLHIISNFFAGTHDTVHVHPSLSISVDCLWKSRPPDVVIIRYFQRGLCVGIRNVGATDCTFFAYIVIISWHCKFVILRHARKEIWITAKIRLWIPCFRFSKLCLWKTFFIPCDLWTASDLWYKMSCVSCTGRFYSYWSIHYQPYPTLAEIVSIFLTGNQVHVHYSSFNIFYSNLLSNFTHDSLLTIFIAFSFFNPYRKITLNQNRVIQNW